MGFIILKQGIAYRIRAADEANATGSDAMNMATGDTQPAVVVAGKDSIATNLGELGVSNGAVLSTLKEHGTTSVDGPVTAQQGLLGFHEGAGGLAEGNSLEMNVLGGILLATQHLDEVRQDGGLNLCVFEICFFSWEVVEGVCLGIMKPLSGGIELLEDVFYKAMGFVHAHLAVVLPAALILHLVFFVLAGDAVVVATPAVGVNGVDVATGGIFPVSGALRAEGVSSVAVVDGDLRVVVWEASHMF